MNQLSRINPEASGNLEQIVQVQIAPSALDLAEKRPMDATAMCQGFLAQALRLAAGPDPGAQGGGGRRDRFCHGRARTYRPTVCV